MLTISSTQLCATSAGIATSALGLSLVTNDHHRVRSKRYTSTPNSHDRDMSLTTTTIFTFSAGIHPSPTTSLPSSYTYTTPEQPRRAPTVNSAPPHFKPRSVSENADTLLNRDEKILGVLGDEERSAEEIGSPIRVPQRRTWFRRLSSSMSSSRESSRDAASRPASAAVSQSNGSLSYSHAGSTTPIFSASTYTLPPNKLVKRSSSIEVKASPTTTSRLPLPSFRRPATSHQRSSMQLERLSDAGLLDHTIIDDDLNSSRDSQWRLYFTPRVAQDDNLQRRRSTSIPNPIRRIYPDRKYRPTLISGAESTTRGDVDYDDGISSIEGSVQADTSVASSPMLSTGFEQQPTPRRSFSIGDLLSTGPQPLWRSSKSRAKALRRRPRRPSSTSQTDMGSMLSVTDEADRPVKRRGLESSRGLYSSSSAITHHSPQESYARQSSEILSNPSPSSSGEQRRLASSTYSAHSQKPTRLSTTTSEITSGADSDSEYRSFGDTSTDYQSDNIFDSIPTRTTRSSSGRRGPHIDTIFDETPPSFSSGRSTKLKDFLSQDSNSISDNVHRYSTIEEEESVSTPIRSARDKSITSSPTARGGSQAVFSSSPPMLREMPDPDEIDWDAPDDMLDLTAGVQSHSIETPQRSLPLRFAPAAKIWQASKSTPQRMQNGLDRTTIFDWSEAQPSPSHNQSPPRPRTVHGKKDPESRGSRPQRRPVSGMHVRSHSVPVVPDVDGKRNTAANKFGTWGVGSKAVTEDWNEDFEFDAMLSNAESSAAAEKRIDSGHEFMVPRMIREQQQNVVANISLLREWGLLIEELKELRMRAVALDMLSGSSAQAWSEVDAMIELADQETEEHTLEPRRSPPSSPGFDYSAFEEPVPELPHNLGLTQAFRLPEPLEPQSPPPTINLEGSMMPQTPNRPRKDSEAVARSVIEALHSRRAVSDPAALQPVPASRKVPFDTATLRHIVPYVNGLKRKVKDALRETEGLYRSPSVVRHSHPRDENDNDNDEEEEENSFEHE